MKTQHDMFKKMSETEKAYLAGFVDGEGCICITKHYNKKRTRSPIYHLDLSISSTNLEIVEYIANMTGAGSIHIGVKENEDHRAGYIWVVGCNKAIDVLNEIYPYLRIKKTQAEIAFLFQKTMSASNRRRGVPKAIMEQREAYYLTISSLKGYKSKWKRVRKKTEHTLVL
jgi:hypothetical protein